MLVVLLIVLGVAFGGGGFAYWYTSKHPEILAATPSTHPPGPPPPTTPQANALIPVSGPMADDGPPPPPLAAAKETPLPFGEVIKGFSYKTDHVVWVLPPGIHAKGPFNADVSLKHGDDTVFHQTIPLTADFPTPGSKAQYPRSAEIVRLTADDTWPKHYADVMAAVGDAKTKFGGGELDITSSFTLNFDPEMKANYCMSGAMPDVRIFLEDAETPILKPLDLTQAAPIVAKAMFAGCK